MDDIMVISMIGVWIVVGFNLLLTVALVRRVSELGQTSNGSSRQQGLPAGQTAPAFTAETLDGQPVSLATYAGQPVAFLFISTDCGPCKEALPSYEALYPQAARAGVKLVLVSTDAAAATRTYLAEHPVRIPMLVAPRASNPFMEDYHLTRTPSYCLVDAAGRIQSAGYPSFEWGDWKRLAETWTAQAPQIADLMPSIGGG